MPTPDKTIAVINASGRQAASLIRVVTVLGYTVRAQLRDLEGVVATEVSSNPNVECLVGELYTRHRPTEENKDVSRNGPLSGVGVNHQLIDDLFRGAHLAFINTTYYGNEVQIGKALADAAKKAGIQHYIYSSMPDHALHNPEPPATFIYTGIYNNNFTSLPYPLFAWSCSPTIFKDGPRKWAGQRVPLAYEMLTPLEVCDAFQRGTGRPVKYVRGPIQVRVPVPEGYRDQLETLEQLFTIGKGDPKKQAPPYFADLEMENSCPAQAMRLWEAPRGNGTRRFDGHDDSGDGEYSDDGDEDEGLVMSNRGATNKGI
ncbi:unnamed protein product [Parascedosporium putredinis]|uniref:NmrA-like domain-containing protein n=1 Tax=Parascedosporium putredinis TaxID=1442378 RepID=A0A9P1M6U1_9PEZI|nr:unnamed protein product [Parascedosporium putredinis]CAI7987491.1 unnamed protein product [Parascedosporium putredinis]